MPTLRRRKAKEQDKENTDAMIDGAAGEQEFDDGDHESDADFEGSREEPKDDMIIDGGAARCQATWIWATGAVPQKPQWSRRTF